jgi:hypothetical protein
MACYLAPPWLCKHIQPCRYTHLHTHPLAFGIPDLAHTSLSLSPEQIAHSMLSLAERQRCVLAAQCSPDMYAAVRRHAPGAYLKLTSPS